MGIMKSVNTYNSLILIIIMSLAGFSCEKDLDLEPKTSLSTDVFFQTEGSNDPPVILSKELNLNKYSILR